MYTEMITEVDENDIVLGLRPRSDFYDGAYIHRSVSLFLFNRMGELLVVKRGQDQKWFPSLYSYSMTATVGDESCEKCLKREMDEELGLDISFIYVGKYYSETNNCNKAWKKVYTALYISDKNIKNIEGSESLWVDTYFLIEDIKKHSEKYTPSFIHGCKEYIDICKKILLV